MIPCSKCACDLFEMKCDADAGDCWLACWHCGEIKRNDAIPIGIYYGASDGRHRGPWTALTLHRITNADGLDGTPWAASRFT